MRVKDTKPKNQKFIVYINEFDKFDVKNEPICRNIDCKI